MIKIALLSFIFTVAACADDKVSLDVTAFEHVDDEENVKLYIDDVYVNDLHLSKYSEDTLSGGTRVSRGTHNFKLKKGEEVLCEETVTIKPSASEHYFLCDLSQIDQ